MKLSEIWEKWNNSDTAQLCQMYALDHEPVKFAKNGNVGDQVFPRNIGS